MLTPFSINIDSAIINDLKSRLANTRWPDEIDNEDWKYGTSKHYLQELCQYWLNKFDWNAQQAALNKFPQYKINVVGHGIHFLYVKGNGTKNVPLLLTHGWPDSFVRFLKLIPLLTKPDDNGFSFDVVVPSIPGFGFSSKPGEPGMNPAAIAEIFCALMVKELGYQKFYAHGGDWGSTITELIAQKHPENVIGIHLTDIPFSHLFNVPNAELSEPEKKYLEQGKQWQQKEGAYALIQSTKPQTLAYGLNDSPAGLASWIVEKFSRWSDNGGNLEKSFSKDELLVNLTIYWATETINSACRIYREAMESLNQPGAKSFEKIQVPTGVAIFPKDLVPAPREYGDRIFNIRQWTNMPRGGHFAAMEEPALLAEDIKKFVHSEMSQ